MAYCLYFVNIFIKLTFLSLLWQRCRFSANDSCNCVTLFLPLQLLIVDQWYLYTVTSNSDHISDKCVNCMECNNSSDVNLLLLFKKVDHLTWKPQTSFRSKNQIWGAWIATESLKVSLKSIHWFQRSFWILLNIKHNYITLYQYNIMLWSLNIMLWSLNITPNNNNKLTSEELLHSIQLTQEPVNGFQWDAIATKIMPLCTSF
jgi:hypothetical protein